jgi:hypothetical protein
MNDKEHVKNGIDRRAVLDGAGALATALAAGPEAALADVRGANVGMPRSFEKINKYLKERDYEELAPLPDGYSPLLLIVGAKPPANVDGVRVLPRNFDGTLLVRYPYLSKWVVSEPKVDSNAESGTIVASEGAKGTSCIFYSERLPEGITSLGKVSDATLGKAITNLIKDDLGEIKIKNRKITTAPGGEENLTYDTEFSVFRGGNELFKSGVASAVIRGNSIVGNSISYLPKRAKELKEVATYVAANTRVYSIPTPKEFIDPDDTTRSDSGY